eukprot:COSAG01_NODE_3116_length_6565_cov_2.533406_2_plen_226_part_00
MARRRRDAVDAAPVDAAGSGAGYMGIGAALLASAGAISWYNQRKRGGQHGHGHGHEEEHEHGHSHGHEEQHGHGHGHGHEEQHGHSHGHQEEHEEEHRHGPRPGVGKQERGAATSAAAISPGGGAGGGAIVVGPGAAQDAALEHWLALTAEEPLEPALPIIDVRVTWLLSLVGCCLSCVWAREALVLTGARVVLMPATPPLLGRARGGGRQPHHARSRRAWGEAG